MARTTTRSRIDAAARLACAWLVALAVPALAQDADCVRCHGELAQKKTVHAALQAGCKGCHAGLDASAVPHKSTGSIAKGLAAEPRALCLTCHDAKLFEGKHVHGPVAAGPCTTCHDAHASDAVALLRKDPAALCLDCHADVKKRPHLIVAFYGGGHPLGDAAKAVPDPLRAGKPFYCAACHEPHRSERPRLGRFDKGMQACQACHKI